MSSVLIIIHDANLDNFNLIEHFFAKNKLKKSALENLASSMHATPHCALPAVSNSIFCHKRHFCFVSLTKKYKNFRCYFEL